MIKLYLDDLRTPDEKDFIVVRSCEEAVRDVTQHGMPEFISFDHDLGTDEEDNLLPSGYDFAKWLVEADLDGVIAFPGHFTFRVHSQNPVGRKNIEALLLSYLGTKDAE